MTKEKRCLIAISVLMQIVFTFFDVFFSIFVYDVSKNLNIIILYTLTTSIFFLTAVLFLYRFLNKKVLSILYKISFFLSLIAIGLTFTISINRIYMIFIAQIVLKLTQIFYYMPHEIATMTTNKTSQMRKFLGLSTTLSLVAGFMSPFLSGLIIDYASYYIIFGILLAISVVTLILSFNVSPIKEDTQKFGLIKFIKESHKIKKMRYGYLANMFFKLSNDGVVAAFLPLLIFLRTGTNFSVGLYASIASVLSGVALIVYSYFTKNNTIIMWICTICQVCVSIFIIAFSNIIWFFVYYFVKRITNKILNNGLCETLFTLPNNTPLSQQKIENFYVYSFYNHTGVVFACIISLIVYNLINNVTSITILLGVFSLFLILFNVFLNKSDKLTVESSEEQNKLNNIAN